MSRRAERYDDFGRPRALPATDPAFAALFPGAQFESREGGSVIRITIPGAIADYWPRRQKWHDITRNIRGQGLDRLRDQLYPSAARALGRNPGLQGDTPETSGFCVPDLGHPMPAAPFSPKPRTRVTLDRHFACDECYRRFRLGLPLTSGHDACAERLARRRVEVPL